MTIRVACDIDGTLFDLEGNRREDIIEMIETLGRCPNVMLYIWSGGGIPYAEAKVAELGLQTYDGILPKFARQNIDIAFDDEQVTLGRFNIQVRPSGPVRNGMTEPT